MLTEISAWIVVESICNVRESTNHVDHCAEISENMEQFNGILVHLFCLILDELTQNLHSPRVPLIVM